MVGDSEAVTVVITWRKAGNIEEFKRRSQHTLHRAKSEAVSRPDQWPQVPKVLYKSSGEKD